MRINKLKAVVYQLMLAGCVSVSVSTPAFAGNFFDGKFSYSEFHKAYPEYRFRPVEKKSFNYHGYPSRGRYSYRAHQRPVTVSYRPNAGFSPAYVQKNRSVPVLAYQSTRPVSAYNHFTRTLPSSHYQKPAFARQYAWEAAQPRGFRRGGGNNYYSNQSNATVEQSSATVYRTAPVTSQGYQYRAPARNANFVTFSDRVMKSLKPVSHDRFARHQEVHLRAKPAARQEQLSKAYKAGHVANSLGNYRFRPDARFQQPVAETRSRNIAAAVPVSYQLANAELSKTSNNPWDQWSFRPVDSTF